MNRSPESPEILDLRRLLRERFPAAHGDRGRNGAHGDRGRNGAPANERPTPPADKPSAEIPMGISCLEDVAKGTITEIVSPSSSAGNALLIHGLLQGATRQGRYIALVDGCDTFDPQSAGLEACGKLLWARCASARQAIAAADLLLRDGNLGLVAMDLQLNPLRELSRLPSSSWHRLRGLAEKSGAALIALTPQRIIASAHLRVELDGAFALDAFDFPREELRDKLLLRILRRRGLALTPAASSSSTTERKVG